jgi:hypothetical protein
VSGIRHPFNRSLYEDAGGGRVRVTTTDGRTGLFRRDGCWIEGDLREADPQLCCWLADPRTGHHRLEGAQPHAAPLEPTPSHVAPS